MYGSRLRYYTYDVTDLVHPGANAVGAWLGDGWYRGRLGWRGGFRNLYGYDQSFLGQLELTYADGSREVVATDASWRSAPSPILHSGLYDGEDYDAREEQPGWSTAGLRRLRLGAACRSATATRPRSSRRRLRRCARPRSSRPIAVLTGPSGSRILDFGQNLVGPRAHPRLGRRRAPPSRCAPPR